MKPASFNYLRPKTVPEAIEMLVAHGGDAKIIAGGQSLVPMMNFRLLTPGVLVDINGIAELNAIDQTAGGVVRIGALVRHHQLMSAPVISARYPVLTLAMRHVAHLAIRNRGTIGGSLSHADPAAELPMMAVLLDATLRLVGPNGSRDVAAASFFTGALSTVLASEELLTEVLLPQPKFKGWAFHEFAARAGDFALAGVGITLTSIDDRAADVRIAVMGVGDTPLRMTAAEEVINGRSIDAQSIDAAVEAVRVTVMPSDDLHGSAEYRRHLVGGLVRRSLQDAWLRAVSQSKEQL